MASASEDHANSRSQNGHVLVLGENILAIQQDLAVDVLAGI